LLSFNSYLSARERLESWIEDHILCLRYCGLTDDEAICFNHQIKKCNGICSEAEEQDIYNRRAQAILERYIYSHGHFALIDRGKTAEERSVILVENGCYAGYGYLGAFDQVSSAEDFKNAVKKTIHYPDADDLIKSWMKKNRYKLIPLAVTPVIVEDTNEASAWD
jgi:DNA polymerase-3 subunit epsilon